MKIKSTTYVFFRRRFTILRTVFKKLYQDLVTIFPHVFGTLENAAQNKAITSEKKVLACIHFLGTGRAFDNLDDGARTSGES